MKNKIYKVLLVEDDEDDYLIVEALLSDIQDSSYELDWVQCYTEALVRIRQESFDVYLVDFRLGERSGLDLLKELNGKCRTLPVILLTGLHDRRIDLAAMQAGASDFLVKGQINPNLLERAIRYAIERTRLINAINEMAIRDELTGLYNRREMNRLLKEEIDRIQRYGSFMSLIMLDIDHFKQVNDTYGHIVGDQVLKQLSKVIRDEVRSLDRPIRYGGEEFTIILPETSGVNALRVAERLRISIANHTFDCEMEDKTRKLLSITISLGVAEFSAQDGSTRELLAAADQALYAAKKQGRNQTVVFGHRIETTMSDSNNML